MIEAVRANGGTVGSDVTGSIDLAPDVRNSLVRDPDGFLMLLSPPRPPSSPKKERPDCLEVIRSLFLRLGKLRGRATFQTDPQPAVFFP